MSNKIVLYTAFFLFFIPFIGYSQNTIKHGFKDVQLDSYKSSISGLVYLNDFDGYEVYERKNQDLKIGDIKLENVKYFFYQGKLTEIRVYFDSFRFDALVDLFTSTYGKHSGLDGHVYSWGNSMTSITMTKSSGPFYYQGKTIHPYFTISSRETYINKSNDKTANRAKDL